MEIHFLKEPFVVGHWFVSSRLFRKPFVVRLILTWGILCLQILTRDPFVLRAILKPIVSRLWDNRGLFHAQDYFLLLPGIEDSSSLWRAVGIILRASFWESSSLEKGNWHWVAQSSFEGFIFLCKTIWTYKEFVKTTFGGVPISFKLAIMSVKWMSLKCWLHFQIAIENIWKMLLQNYSQYNLISSWFQVTSALTIETTSGFPLSPSFASSLSTFKRFLVSAQHFISNCCFGMELPLKELSQHVPLKFCVFQQT